LDPFSSRLIAESGITTSTYDVSLDSLADQVRIARETLRRAQDHLTDHSVSKSFTERSVTPWADEVAKWLEDTAVPIFTRRMPVDPETAAAIRLAALCLAGEVCGESSDEIDPSVGLQFRQIVAGITLLERRLSGQVAPTETILVALAY
jgi:hypothetical protein